MIVSPGDINNGFSGSKTFSQVIPWSVLLLILLKTPPANIIFVSTEEIRIFVNWEEPLLNSNNVYTVGTLIRFNTLVCKEVYDVLGVVPEFVSTYNSRKFAFPHLVQKNDKGKFVLFGGLPKDIDKKVVIWELVAKREPQIIWSYTKNNTLKKESYDMTDSYACALGYMKMKEIW